MKLSKLTVYTAYLLIIAVWLGGANLYARFQYKPGEIPSASFKTTAGGCRDIVNYAVHNVGLIGLTVANMGHFGRGFLQYAGVSLQGDVPSCTYPYPGLNSYLFAGSFWIGAIVGRDTLVSVGADGWAYTMEM